MGVQRLDDLIAHQFAEEFKAAVYLLLNSSTNARRDFKFRSQLQDSAAGVASAVAEGFGRCRAGEFAVFIRYALASLQEARVHLRDGIDRHHFSEADCQVAFLWAHRSRSALLALYASQRRLIAADKSKAAHDRGLRRS
jgi:four helix bundle protein